MFPSLKTCVFDSARFGIPRYLQIAWPRCLLADPAKIFSSPYGSSSFERANQRVVHARMPSGKPRLAPAKDAGTIASSTTASLVS